MDEKLTPPRYASFAYSCNKRALFLDKISFYSVLMVAIIYIATVATLILSELILGIGFVAISGLPFIILSFARRFINAKRPYELYDVSAIAPHLQERREGVSFPSRHVFSAFLIGTALMFTSLAIGLIVLTLGVIIAVCRVLLLIHFPRDVIAGAVIGAIAGVIGALALGVII